MKIDCDFNLHPKLISDTILIKNLELSSLLLKKDSEIPWIILVPRVANLVEMIDLSDELLLKLNEEIKKSMTMMKVLFHPYKLNVANIGNQVRQLHIHIIARYENDRAWPDPIWGVVSQNSHDERKFDSFKEMLTHYLK